MRSLILTAFFVCLATLVWSKPVFEITPLEGAPYSAAATVDPLASIVFTKSYTSDSEDMLDAATSVFEELESDLESAGISLDSVVNVRGYLLSEKGQGMGSTMSKWSEAFSAAFEGEQEAPTRTSIGVSALPGGATLAMDAVVASAPETFGELSTTWANERISMPEDASVSLRAVKPYSSMLITSGVLADALPGEGAGFGSMEQQSASALSKLDDVLKSWGLSRADLAFVRVMLSPVTDEEGSRSTDFEGFDAAWESFWSETANGIPPVSVFSAPGFGSTGRIVEIEFYAVFPDATGPFGPALAEGEAKGPAWREGSESSFLSRSVAVARDAKLTWFSGVIDRNEKNIYNQAMQSLLTMEKRLAAEGLDYPDVIQLRAYLNIQDSFGAEFGAWNNAYRRFFDHAKLNPEKPVRTAFPIEELPAGALIEIEALGISN
ncbi:RidA family protein [Pelagicoccus albus]|uniref:Enamine deaminase RidA, house cleaning of reactive enamine intermediates, YjgF/YER057c/UK114 family n=1 Tax=Pelagicoccus albus TaxID=415222 RepID=A0A7X1E8W7_9BACT|nr:RidA family protein [Pelagicoccus albus]MBC2607190.1 hypothetical protein [Pelagicoccus albus]